MFAQGNQKEPKPAIEAAIAALERGAPREAAKQIWQEISKTPDSAMTRMVAGTVLLMMQNPDAAHRAFLFALRSRPKEPFARYGAALSQLAQGYHDTAQDNLRLAQADGAFTAQVSLAQKYLDWLRGRESGIEAKAEGLETSFAALSGIAEAKRGDAQRARTALEAALQEAKNTPLPQAWGVLMSFEQTRPLRSAYGTLPAFLNLDVPGAPANAVRGQMQISPDDVPANVAYVSFEVDTQAIGVVSTRPFSLGWDSQEVPNGWHTLKTIFYDSGGGEMRRTARRIRVLNPETLSEAESRQQRNWIERLWRVLSLQPDRAMCAYTLGELCMRAGDRTNAQRWFWQTAAIRPDFKDIRQKLLASGAMSVASEPMYGGLPSEKWVALTFDDGPKPGITEALLQILQEAQAPSTFFVIGRHVAANPELTRKILDAGMELANHSYTHRNMTRIGAGDLTREIAETQAAIFWATGKTPRFLRPPGGNWNERVAAEVKIWGLTPGFWTVDVYGSEIIGAQDVAKATLDQVKPGSVVLMHNGRANTLQALPIILRELKRRGYTLVTMETLERRLLKAQRTEREAIRQRAEKRKRITE